MRVVVGVASLSRVSGRNNGISDTSPERAGGKAIETPKILSKVRCLTIRRGGRIESTDESRCDMMSGDDEETVPFRSQQSTPSFERFSRSLDERSAESSLRRPRARRARKEPPPILSGGHVDCCQCRQQRLVAFGALCERSPHDLLPWTGAVRRMDDACQPDQLSGFPRFRYRQ